MHVGANQGRSQGMRGLPSYNPPQTPQNRILNIYFIDIMLSKVSHDFPMSQNQPLKSADD
jgi:hypothetical protein